MKKTFKIFIFTAFISLIGLLNVSAASLILEGNDTVSGGNTGNYKILIDCDDEEVAEVEFRIGTDNASLISIGFIESKNYNTKLSSGLYNISGTFKKNDVIGTITVTNKNIVNLATLINLEVSDIKFNTTGESEKHTKKITLTPGTTSKPKSPNAKLTGLSVTGGGILTPGFNTSVTSYKIMNLRDTIKSVTISPKCDSCNYVIRCETGCTNHNNQVKPELMIGKNILKILTTSEDGKNTAEYDLIIYRGETTDNSSFLENLTIENFKLTEKFDKEKLDYTLKVPNDTTKLNIIAKPEDSEALVEIKGADELIVGENVITITITSSETKDKKIYNITVTRLDEDEVMTTTQPVVDIENNKKSKTLLVVIITLIGLSIIGAAVYFIFIKKKKDKGDAELITDEGNIESNNNNTEIDIKENSLIDELNITDEKTKPTVDEALADLMTTKEIILNENN